MRSRITVALVIATVLAYSPVRAQRSFSATYERGGRVRIEGAVTRIEWTNPHAFLFLDVRGRSGDVTNWAVEIGNPLELERDGWKQTTVRVGDLVSVEGIPARGQRKQASATSVTLTSSGKRLFVVSRKRAAPRAAPTPRWPDGHVRLGAPPGSKGYWGAATASALTDSTAGKISMHGDGLLTNIADAGRVAPFKPWAKALYEYRQKNLLKDDPIARCVPPGGPRQFHSQHGFQFVEQPDLGRILLLHGGGNRNWRAIYTDGRPLAQAAELVLSFYGTSVGRWDKDTLVVESLGYNEKFWLTNGGLPHTEALHLTERFSRPDLNTLKYEVTVDDPRTYTRPWSGGWTIAWVPDEEIQEFFCEDNAEQTFNR